MPLISVVIPFYRELDLIGRAVSSVVQQELPLGYSIEIVIGNDGKFSEGEIRSRLTPQQNSLCQIVKNRKDNGAGNARNAALDCCQGEYYAFLDADDYWCEQKLFRQIELVHAGATFVSGGYMFEGSNAEIHAPTMIQNTKELLTQLRVSTSSVLMTKELCGDSRFSNLRFSQDTEFWARLAGKRNFKYASVPALLALYAPSGRTSNKFVQAIAFRQVVRMFSLPILARLEIYVRYATRGVLNHYVRR